METAHTSLALGLALGTLVLIPLLMRGIPIGIRNPQELHNTWTDFSILMVNALGLLTCIAYTATHSGGVLYNAIPLFVSFICYFVIHAWIRLMEEREKGEGMNYAAGIAGIILAISNTTAIILF